MQIIRGFTNLDPKTLTNGSVVTIGNYDGVHLGHQAILSKVHAIATQSKLPSVLITFEPQPREYFLHKHYLNQHHADLPAPCRLLTWREKFTLLRICNIDKLLILPFNDTLAHLTALDFIRTILVDKLHAKYVIVGEDFKFGAKHGGDVNLLQQHGLSFGFQTIFVPDYSIAKQRVSSSLIRKSLQHSDLSAVHQFLGRPYSVTGKIIGGDRRGRSLGIPTANIYVHHKIIPFSGVYIVRVHLCDKPQPLRGVANIGIRPTLTAITATPRRLLEFHLLDFNQNIYGKIAKVEFLHKIREEQKFASLEELKEQMKRDVALTKKYNFV